MWNDRIKIIQNIVAREFNVPLIDLIADRRDRTSTNARHIAFWITRNYTEASFPVIAKEFDRDHTTVLYGVRKADILIERSPIMKYLTRKCILEFNIQSSALEKTHVFDKREENPKAAQAILQRVPESKKARRGTTRRAPGR